MTPAGHAGEPAPERDHRAERGRWGSAAGGKVAVSLAGQIDGQVGGQEHRQLHVRRKLAPLLSVRVRLRRGVPGPKIMGFLDRR
jgi:hypothetical protein